MAPKRPNILFITADQWRGDCVGAAGHDVVKTPHCDALAAEGTLFQRHYSAAAPCSPARAALYSGLLQMNNRTVSNGTPMSHRLDNMARAARRGGYLPVLFGYTDISADPRAHDPNDPELKTYEGVLPGFQVEQALIGDQAPWKRWLKTQGYSDEVAENPYALDVQEGQAVPNGPTAFKAEHSQSAYLAGRFIEWLEEQDGTPWFAHLSLIHPHPPIAAPAPYHEMYAPGQGADFAPNHGDLDQHPIVRRMADQQKARNFVPGATGMVSDLTEEDLRRMRAVYYGLVTEVDAQIGRVVEHLKATGQWEDTIIIVTSDHGEMMGDHGMLGKGGFFMESQHVPLVIRIPGQSYGQIYSGLTSSVDLMPTLLDIWGVEPENSLDGKSLMPAIHDIETTTHDAVMWEFDFRGWVTAPDDTCPEDYARGSHLLARLDDDALQVRSPNMPELLFDLHTDPQCTRNVIDDPAYADLRLAQAEALIADRMRANDQTLCNIELTDEGAVHRFKP